MPRTVRQSVLTNLAAPRRHTRLRTGLPTRVGVSLGRVRVLRAAVARGEYDTRARLEGVVTALLREIRRGRKAARQPA